MTQTDAEIVARAIRERFPLVLKYEAENLASVAVDALTEAGRLVGERPRCSRCAWFAGGETGACGKLGVDVPDTFWCAAWEPTP